MAVVTYDSISVRQDAATLPRNTGSSKECVISLDSLRTKSLNFILFLVHTHQQMHIFILKNTLKFTLKYT